MEKNNKNNPKNTNEQQLFSENKKGKIGSNGKPSAPRAKEGYCNDATQSGPSTHSQSHQTHNISKNTAVKQRMAWTREEITEIRKCYTYIAECISQTTIRRCMKYEDNQIQTVECTWMQRSSQTIKNMS
jgi:hypothetical protein